MYCGDLRSTGVHTWVTTTLSQIDCRLHSQQPEVTCSLLGMTPMSKVSLDSTWMKSSLFDFFPDLPELIS